MKNEDIQIRLIAFLVFGVISSGVSIFSTFIRRQIKGKPGSPSKEAATILGAGFIGGLLGAYSIEIVPTSEVKPLQ